MYSSKETAEVDVVSAETLELAVNDSRRIVYSEEQRTIPMIIFIFNKGSYIKKSEMIFSINR